MQKEECDLEKVKIIRGAIEHEGTLENNRLTWLGVFEGLLFIAFFEKGILTVLIACVGIALAVSTLFANIKSGIATIQLLYEYKRMKIDNDYPQVLVVGLMDIKEEKEIPDDNGYWNMIKALFCNLSVAKILDFIVFPGVLIPVVLIIAWILIILL